MCILTCCWRKTSGGGGCAATWRTPSTGARRCPSRAAGAARARRRTRPPRCTTATAATTTWPPRGTAPAADARARACPTRTPPRPQSCRPTNRVWTRSRTRATHARPAHSHHVKHFGCTSLHFNWLSRRFLLRLLRLISSTGLFLLLF